MQIMPIDVTALISVILGISIVLVPVIGLTARFALKPTVEALSHFFEHKGLQDTVDLLERRMALLEQQMEGLEGGVKRIEEAAAFHEALGEPGPTGRLGSGDSPEA
jgi:hypothetical protein